ncbi:M66 family metalloprotease [Limnohabitans sp.]|uniref:M66 family metalloprotease n=1 Tax=Limnohabitans sp. TaxID=1907725 RepID=UPI00286ECE31|nr:M66 family metalloprotease [Limnohabitans sp.]
MKTSYKCLSFFVALFIVSASGCGGSAPSTSALDTPTGAAQTEPDALEPQAVSQGATKTSPADLFKANVAVALLSNGATADDWSTVRSFYDVTRDGATRPIRNDLVGELSGMVQFVQSHSINPRANVDLPHLVALRMALLLFTPSTPIDSAKRVTVTVLNSKGNSLTLDMNAPEKIPRSDKPTIDNRPDVVYSKRAWSVELPWDWVDQGMSLQFSSSASKLSGTLPASAIEMGPPVELVITQIRLGMLTDPPVFDPSCHSLTADPVLNATDYFQTLPISRLVVADYEPVTLLKTIIRSGKIYTDHSDYQNADVYSGDLRGDVAKSQHSVGVHLANQGLTSNDYSQQYYRLTNRFAMHHAAGRYSTSVPGVYASVGVGLSGGGGLGTLYCSSGNEFSHEIGHSHGLGHWPGADFSAPVSDSKLRRATHHRESGWEYIAHRKRMRANFQWVPLYNPAQPLLIFNPGSEFYENYDGYYYYSKDAMSGGGEISQYSIYTFHTGYSAYLMQSGKFESYAIEDLSFRSGYKKWNPTTKSFQDAAIDDDTFAQKNYPKPKKIGVPVLSIFGGYNPGNAAQNLIYPAFRANHGNVFDDNFPKPNLASTSRQCWLEVAYRDGGISTQASLNASDGPKQLQINLEEARKPRRVDLYCRSQGNDPSTQVSLSGIDIDASVYATPMKPPAIVGQKDGFNALRTRELNALNTALESMADSGSLVLSAASQLSIQSWLPEGKSVLTAKAQKRYEDLLARQAYIASVTSFVQQNRTALNDPTSSQYAALIERLVALLQQDAVGVDALSILGTSGSGDRLLTQSGSTCVYLNDSIPSSPQPSGISASNSQCDALSAKARWFSDSSGGIHNSARADLCLTVAASNFLSLTACNTANLATQQWRYLADHASDPALGHYQSMSNTNNSMDSSGQNVLVYGTHTGNNQYWRKLPVSSSQIFVVFSADVIQTLTKVLSN